MDIPSNVIEQMMRSLANELRGTIMASNTSTSSTRDRTPNERARAATMSKAEKNQSEFYKQFIAAHKEDSKNSQNLQTQLQYSNRLFEKAVDSAGSIKELHNRLPAAFSHAFKESGSVFMNTLGENINDLTDVFSAQTKIENMPQVINLMKQFRDGEITVNAMNQAVRDLGYTSEELVGLMDGVNARLADANGIIDGNIHNYAAVNVRMEELAKESTQASKALGAVSEELANTSGGLIGKFKRLATVLAPFGWLGKELIDATKAAARFGSTVQVTDAFLMGLAPEELSQLQSEHRQSILALGGSYDEYNELLKESSFEMIRFTGNLGDAVRATADMVSTSRMLGDANVDTAKFVEKQQALFGNFNRTLGTTWEQFSELNKTLSMDTELRGNLIRMDKTRRVQYFQEIQNNYKKLRQEGLLHEQAVALTKTMERMTGKSAKTRIKEGARVSAIMGTVGMGQEGERARAIMMKGARASATEKKELQDILTRANKIIGERMGKDLASELALGGMIEAGGVGEYLGPHSQFLDAALAQGTAAKEGAEAQLLTAKMFGGYADFAEKNWNTWLGVFDRFFAFFKGPYFAAITAIVLASKSGIGGTFNSKMGMGAKALGGATWIAGGATAAAIGYEIGKYINDQILPESIKEGIGNILHGEGWSVEQKSAEEQKELARQQLEELRRANGISVDFIAEQKKIQQEIQKTKQTIQETGETAAGKTDDLIKQQKRTVERRASTFNAAANN